MDPNAALTEIRAALAEGRALNGNATRAALREIVDRATEHFEALDEWLSRGGFAPTAWDHDEEAVVRTAIANLRAGASTEQVAEIMREGFSTTARLRAWPPRQETKEAG